MFSLFILLLAAFSASSLLVPRDAPATPASSTIQAASDITDGSSGSSDLITGGFASFFYQGGFAGACGQVHSDSDLIGAIDIDRYGNPSAVSSLCGEQVQITNTNNNKTVTITIADDCPTCPNSNSFDLSVGAFQVIASLEDGLVPIVWEFV